MTLTLITELNSVLTIAKAIREGCAVYASIPDRSPREKVKGVKACCHLSRREVLTIYGWNHPIKVWMESRTEPAPEARAAAA
jgi:hypothetical protein